MDLPIGAESLQRPGVSGRPESRRQSSPVASTPESISTPFTVPIQRNCESRWGSTFANPQRMIVVPASAAIASGGSIASATGRARRVRHGVSRDRAPELRSASGAKKRSRKSSRTSPVLTDCNGFGRRECIQPATRITASFLTAPGASGEKRSTIAAAVSPSAAARSLVRLDPPAMLSRMHAIAAGRCDVMLVPGNGERVTAATSAPSAVPGPGSPHRAPALSACRPPELRADTRTASPRYDRWRRQ